MAQRKNVLLVDDSVVCLVAIKRYLERSGYTVETVTCAEEALAVFDPKLHDLVLTDNQMPGMSGAELARILKQRCPSTPVLMLTGAPPEDRSWLDGLVGKSEQLLNLKVAIEKLQAEKTLVGGRSDDQQLD
jgi:CheY-like chemotaxis protein